MVSNTFYSLNKFEMLYVNLILFFTNKLRLNIVYFTQLFHVQRISEILKITRFFYFIIYIATYKKCINFNNTVLLETIILKVMDLL